MDKVIGTYKIIKDKLLKQKTLLEEQILRLQSAAVIQEEDLYEANRSGNDGLLQDSSIIKKSLAKSSQKILKEICEALVKIEKGGYGLCIKCGHQIEQKRLMVMPMTSLCIGCK